MTAGDSTLDARKALAIRCVLAAAGLTEGVREATGNNDGAAVELYQAATGNARGASWCHSWAMDVGQTIAAALWPLRGKKAWPLPMSGACDDGLAAARRLGIVHAAPQPGDLFYVLRTDTDATHVGYVAALLKGTPAWRSIEGNTNGGGSRDGDGVYRRQRGGVPDPTRYAFVRWCDALPDMPLLAAGVLL